MSKNLKIWAIRAGLLVLPFIAMAQGGENIQDIIGKLTDLIKDTIIPLLFAVATAWFIWGIVLYITAGGDDTKIQKGRDHMVWGLIGMAIMLSAWGLATAIKNYFIQGGGGSIPTGY